MTLSQLFENPEYTNLTNWADVELPDSWVDERLAGSLWQKLSVIASLPGAHKKKVVLPAGLPGRHAIPAYVLLPYHNLPNGNYSKRISHGYITGFDKVMLNETVRLRQRMAEQFRGCESVLDVGCGGGKLAGALLAEGVRNVWGLDPSPYLLQHAATSWPAAHFVQGVVERLDFDDNSLDGVGAFFLFHELPPKAFQQGLDDIYRVLKPGGRVVFCEPSKLQYEASLGALTRQFGWRGLYFGVLARRVYEPFIKAWHRTDVTAALRQAGFEQILCETSMPATFYMAHKRTNVD